MSLNKRNMNVKLTGQLIDEIALSLVENANDKDIEVREVVADSIVQLGKEKANLILSATVYFLNKDPKLIQSHKITLLNCMEKIMEGGMEKVDDDVAVMVIRQVFIEMTQSKSLAVEWQEAASKVAVSMSGRFCHELMTELFERFHHDQLPHYYVVHTISNLSLANVFGMVPYIKACLGFCLPMLDAAKSDSMRMVFSRMLANFSEAIIDYLANMDTAPDKNVTKAFYSPEFCTAWDHLFNNWVNSKDIKLKSSVIECLGRMSYILPNDMLQNCTQKLFSVIYIVFKKSQDVNMVTEGLYFLIDASLKEDIYLIEPYLDTLLVNLFNQSSHSVDLTSSASVKNHNEVLRCYSILAKSFPERVVSFTFSKLELANERARIGALNIIQHLVNYAGESIKEKEGAIMLSLKNVSTDQNIKIKQTLAQTILKLAHYNYLELEGGKDMIDFIVRHCLLPNKPEKKEATNNNKNNNNNNNNNNNKNLNEINDETLKEFCENVLHLLSSTVPNAALVLWPYLLTYLTQRQYSPVVPVLCKTLTQVLKRLMEKAEDSYRIHLEENDTIPKPQEIFTRLLVLLIQPSTSNRASHILPFLTAISSIIHPKLQTLWQDKISTMTQHLHKDSKEELDQNGWEKHSLELLTESLSGVSNEGWVVLCGDSFIRQLSLYAPCSLEKAFIYKCLGICCSSVVEKEFTKLALTAVFDQTLHSSSIEREACACAIGLASRRHVGYVLEWMEGVSKARKQSVFVSFIKEAVGDLDEKFKATLVLGYGCIATYAPKEEVDARMKSNLIGRLDVNINQIKDPVIRESTVRAIEVTAIAMNKNNRIIINNNNDKNINNKNDGMNKEISLLETFIHRNGLLSRLKALMKQESQTVMNNDLRIIIMTALSALVRLKPPLNEEQTKELFLLVVSRVVTLPAETLAATAASSNSSSVSVDKQLEYEMRMKRCVDGLVAFGGCLLQVETTPVIFSTLFEVLKPHLCSVQDSERVRSMMVVKKLVGVYLNKLNTSMMEPLKNLGDVIARVLPRCCDPNKHIRFRALSSIEMLLKISLRYEGRATDYKDEWVEKVATLKSYLTLNDSEAMFSFVTELSHIMSQKVSIEHVLDYMDGLMGGLSEPEHLSQFACCLLLTNCLKSRGPELHGVVDRTFFSLVSKLPLITNKQTKTGLLRSIRWLTFHHLLKVIGYLLEEPLPLSGVTRDIWQFIGQDKSLIQPITEHLVDMLSRTQPIEELSESMWSKDRTYKRATQLSLAITCAISELLRSDEGYSAVVYLFPRLMTQLMVVVTCYCGARPPKIEKKDGKIDKKRSPDKTSVLVDNQQLNTPFLLGVEALKRFVDATRNETFVGRLKEKDVWSMLLYERVDKCIEAFTTIASCLVTCMPEMLPKIINHLNPILSSPLASQRIMVVAVFAEFINQKCADDMTTVDLLVTSLSARLGDYDLQVKMLCLRGLGNLSCCGEKMLQKYVSMLLSALAAGMEDGGGSGDAELKDLVMVEAMYAMSKVLPKLKPDAVRNMLVNIALRIKPCFEKENPSLRSTSLTLFGDLALIGSDECREPITEQVQINLVSVILHLNDLVIEVVKASQYCLKCIAPVVQCEDLSALFMSYGGGERGKEGGYNGFLQEAAKIMVSEMSENAVTYLSVCLTYFKSSQSTIRCNSVLFLGHLMQGLMEVDSSQITRKDEICRAIMFLLKDEDKGVRMKTARILKNMGNC